MGTTARLLEALEAIRQDRGANLAPNELVAALRGAAGLGLAQEPPTAGEPAEPPLGLYRPQVGRAAPSVGVGARRDPSWPTFRRALAAAMTYHKPVQTGEAVKRGHPCGFSPLRERA